MEIFTNIIPEKELSIPELMSKTTKGYRRRTPMNNRLSFLGSMRKHLQLSKIGFSQSLRHNSGSSSSGSCGCSESIYVKLSKCMKMAPSNETLQVGGIHWCSLALKKISCVARAIYLASLCLCPHDHNFFLIVIS
jgi:hypothetical protein